jgi:hypothetical protein
MATIGTTVYLTPEFVRDIQESKHPNMARQAFGHIFDDQGKFKSDRNDHEYKGMTDGWIRWIQMGGVGLRLIYIRKGANVYLYRIVGKSDENGLSAPASLSKNTTFESLPEDILQGIIESEAIIQSRLLHTTKPTYLNSTIRQMYHLPQSEVILLSPTVSPALFKVSGEIGRFLDRSIEEGARVVLVTAPPGPSQIEFFDQLARRNIEVYFVQNLKTRLFLFRVNEYRVKGPDAVARPTVVLGSAELTHQSLGMGDIGRHEELCYRFPESHFETFYNYADALVKSATDLQGHKIKLGASASA